MSLKDKNQNSTSESLNSSYESTDATDILREAVPAYPSEERLYTIVDYYALPDEQRVELIDGVIYNMGAPSLTHQSIVGNLYRTIANQIADKKGKCKVFLSPLDVQLNSDEWTMVQPDILILCDLDKATNRCIVGAPDFIAEIVSPGSRTRDSMLKLYKYKEAGVREYWMVDPDKENVVVYHFEKQKEPIIYGFQSEIPIGIYDGELVVDFRGIKETFPN